MNIHIYERPAESCVVTDENGLLKWATIPTLIGPYIHEGVKGKLYTMVTVQGTVAEVRYDFIPGADETDPREIENHWYTYSEE
jgi:hypothetical protein